MIIDKPIILENLLPVLVADAIEEVLLERSESIGWSYLPDLTSKKFKSLKNPNPGFGFCFIDDFFVLNPLFYFFNIIIKACPQLDNMRICKGRSFLQLPQPIPNQYIGYNNKHKDMQEPHTVCLYYVNDSEGDTHLFGPDINDPVCMSITPKKNKAVLFDGSIYHSSSRPSFSPRCVLNFDMTEK